MTEQEQNAPVRVNTRISSKYNEWLDRRALETSLSKSALINVAIENYIKESEIAGNVEAMLEKVDGLNRLEEDIKELKKEVKEIKNK